MYLEGSILPNFDSNQITQLYEIYAKTKYLMIKAEELDPERNQTYLQPRLELYQAFDHLMQAYQNAEVLNTEINLASSIKHVTTAFFDIADWLTMLIRLMVDTELREYDSETIKTVLPDYYSVIRPEIDHLSNAISELRKNKTYENTDDVEKYVQLLEQALTCTPKNVPFE